MKYILNTVFIFLISSTAFSQYTEADPSWNQPVEPFKIAGNIYYVGANEITSYLIATPKGHILLDSGFRETVPQITSNIKKLGFDPMDVKFLINSQAHYDHAGGLAELRRFTGAKLLISEGDSVLIRNGGKGDPNFGDRFAFEPAVVDRTFHDGYRLKLGQTTLTANITPGHTPGCTTWTATVKEGGKVRKVVFVCSTSAPGYNLVDNPGYPSIAEDFERSFKWLRSLKPDIFLAAHGSMFDLTSKIELMRREAKKNVFVDPTGFDAYVDQSEKNFRGMLTAQSESKGH